MPTCQTFSNEVAERQAPHADSIFSSKYSYYHNPAWYIGPSPMKNSTRVFLMTLLRRRVKLSTASWIKSGAGLLKCLMKKCSYGMMPVKDVMRKLIKLNYWTSLISWYFYIHSSTFIRRKYWNRKFFLCSRFWSIYVIWDIRNTILLFFKNQRLAVCLVHCYVVCILRIY